MKLRKRMRPIFLGVVLAGAGSTAAAQDIYFGVKGGLMDADIGGFDNAVNIGALIGYDIPGVKQLGGTVSVEGEFTASAIKGDVTGGGDWDVTTFAGYGAYRSEGPLYLKGKAGLAYQRINATGLAGDAKDTAFSWGIGGGMRMGEGRVELEYTWLDDLNFFSVAYLF